MNYYDRFLIVLDAAQWEFCEANGVFNNCDFSVGPLLYSRVQFNELGKYKTTVVVYDGQLQFPFYASIISFLFLNYFPFFVSYVI